MTRNLDMLNCHKLKDNTSYPNDLLQIFKAPESSFSLMIRLCKTLLHGQEKGPSSTQRLFFSPEVLKRISLDINHHSHLARPKSKLEPSCPSDLGFGCKGKLPTTPLRKADPSSTLFYFSFLVIFATSLRQVVLKRSSIVFICRREAISLQCFLRFLSSLINNKIFLFNRKV